MKLDDEVFERRLAGVLRERAGVDAAPSLVRAVLARRSHGEVPHDPAEGVTHASAHWLTAAAILLGAVVIASIAWLRGAEEPQQIAPLPYQEPEWREVSSLDEVAKLPADTRAVHLMLADDAMVEGLLRCPNLECLRISVAEVCVYGLGVKMASTPRPPGVTDAAFVSFAKFPELRVLRLEGTWSVTGIRLGLLRRLEHLEELALSFIDVEDDVLSYLPSMLTLRTLDLSFNHGFRPGALRTVANCAHLRRLSLRGCQQLDGESLSMLVSLRELEELDLGLIDGINWRSDLLPKDERQKRLWDRAQGFAKAEGRGVTDFALRAIARLPRLRVLDVAGAPCTPEGVGELSRAKSLRVLDLFGVHGEDEAFAQALPVQLTSLEVCGDFGDAFCKRLADRCVHLESLIIPACYPITDQGLAALCTLPELRRLDISQSRGLTARCFDALARATRLEFLDIRHCDFVDQDFLARLRIKLPTLKTVLPGNEDR
ncbi:MAG: hypothetical protein U1F36_17725 [Planctomycetota bacterium]